MNNKLMNVTKGLSKFFEIVAWIGTGACIFAGLVGIFARNTVYLITSEAMKTGAMMKTFDVEVFNQSTVGYYIGAVVLTILAASYFSLIAMIFRNIVRIFNSSTPFAADNVIRIREIGIFAISAPFVSLAGEIVSNIMAHGDVVADVELNSIAFGLVILCLSQYFQYGAKLEKDVDGLL